MEQAIVFVGTYTDGTESEGIYTLALDTASGKLRRLWANGECQNPSFLAVHGSTLYAANEKEAGGRLTSYDINNGTGELSFHNGLDTPGSGMCHTALGGGYIYAANYNSGSFVCCSLNAQGGLGELTGIFQDEGGGPNPDRQDGPHAHSLIPSPDGTFLLGCDLGTDQIKIFAPEEGRLIPNIEQAFEPTEPGSGPRHLVYGKNGFVYLACELSNTVMAYRFEGKTGRLLHRQTLSTLREGFFGENTAADIHLSADERYLYVSNRGENTLAQFAVAEDGTLEYRESFDCGGDGPRSFAISKSGEHLLVANQYSGNVVCFALDTETGAIGDKLDEAAVPAAVCVVFKD